MNNFPLPLNNQQDEGQPLSFLNSLPSEFYDQPQPQSEGQLCVDVSETAAEIIVVAAMAGTKPDEIELHLHNDLLTIRGERQSPASADSEPHCQENYWGKFSRTIVLPEEVESEFSRAEYRHGILSVWLTKKRVDSNIPIMIVEE